MTDIKIITDRVRTEIQTASANPHRVFGLPTGLKTLDDRLYGLHEGELTILAGRPGDGKTALATQVAFNVAEYINIQEWQGQVVFFSAEMPADRIIQRYIAQQTGITLSRQLSGDLDEEELSRVEELLQHMEGLPIWIDDSPNINPYYIVNEVGSLKDYGIHLLIIDHLQIAIDRGIRNQYQSVTDAIHTYRGLRDTLKATPMLVLSQLKRPYKDPKAPRPDDDKPHLADLRDSGAIEEAANNVWLLYNPVPSRESGHKRRYATIDIAKCRDGWTGAVELVFDPIRIQFQDLGEEHETEV